MRLPLEISLKCRPSELAATLSVDQLIELKSQIQKVLVDLQENLDKLLEDAMKESEYLARFRQYEIEEQKERRYRNAHALMVTRRKAFIKLMDEEGVVYPEIGGSQRSKYNDIDKHVFDTTGWSQKLLWKYNDFKTAQEAVSLVKINNAVS